MPVVVFVYYNVSNILYYVQYYNVKYKIIDRYVYYVYYIHI